MRPLTRLALAPLCFAALTACSADTRDEAPASVAVEAPAASASPLFGGVDLSAPLSVLGTEPFWAVKIADGAAVLSRMDEVEASYSVDGFTISDTNATVSHRDFSLTLTANPCSDGMSDRTYPLTSEVRVGEETLKGCAIPTSELEKYRP